MAIPVVCRKCNRRYTAPDRLAGMSRACPSCGEPLHIPAASAPAGATCDAESRSVQAVSIHGSLIPQQPKRDYQNLVDMTAMVDVVFFLLIFFLVCSLCKLQASLPAPRPEPVLGRISRGSSAVDVPLGEALTVSVDQDDVIWFENDAVTSVQDLTIRLRKAREASTLGRLRIAGNPQATHGKIVMVMDAAVSAGMNDIQLAIEESGE